ncbi:MAG: hypothetical protein HPY73_01620 [Methanomassiliicoccales archaeon]|nr:MAG: hypothetical protein HPY73_01620 [Methanomassiliicoccales archaeon]
MFLDVHFSTFKPVIMMIESGRRAMTPRSSQIKSELMVELVEKKMMIQMETFPSCLDIPPHLRMLMVLGKDVLRC